MPVMEYDHWKNFIKVIKKAIESVKHSYPQKLDHFAEVGKMIKIAEGTDKEAVREIRDYKLTRYACYLIAQNGDSRNPEMILASVELNLNVINSLKKYIVVSE